MLAVILCFCICVSAVIPQNILDLDEGDICEQQGEDLWSCQKLRQCATAQDIVNNNKKPNICSYVGSEPIVCCQPTGTILRQAGTKSEQKCRDYAKAVYMNYSDPVNDEIMQINTCALVEPTIVGGVPAQPREYPHMALIGFGDKPNVRWNCGGSLISEQYVLSAAHCWGEAKWVRLGEYNINSTKDDKNKEAQPKDYEIAQRIDHPEYKRTGINNDITLYRLKQSVKFNEYIRPVCLQREYAFDKTFAIATGWGRTEYGGPKSDVLLKVNLTIIEKEKCLEFYQDPSQSSITAGITGGAMLCAGDLVKEKDTCQNDSGGPLQIRLKDPYCMYSQVGITSAGILCASRRPGIYTRVSHYVPWIEGIVWP